jgi:hypothetical protein
MVSDMEMAKMKEIISETSYLAHRSKWLAIEHLLDNIDYTETPGILLCWVRSTVPMNKKLYNWQKTVYKIKDELDRRGLNSDPMLRGLLNETY